MKRAHDAAESRAPVARIWEERRATFWTRQPAREPLLRKRERYASARLITLERKRLGKIEQHALAGTNHELAARCGARGDPTARLKQPVLILSGSASGAAE